MLDPRDLDCQDELAFALGKRLRPFVATEVRLREALERYYDVPLDPHLETLAERLDRQRYAPSAPSDPPRSSPTPAGARTRRIWEEPEAALFSEEHTRPAVMPAAGSAGGSGRAAAASAALAADSAAQPVRRRRTAPRPVSVTLTDEERRELRVPSPAAPPAAEPPPGTEDDGEETRPIPADAPPIPPSFSEMETRLRRSRTPDEIGNLLAAFLGQQFERVALFKVLRDRVVGWKGAGPSIDAEKLPDFSADFSGPSIFLNLRSAGTFYLGPLPPMAIHRTLARTWGGSLPRECLVLPVRIHGRLVTVIYLDRAPESLGKLDLDALLRLAVVTGEAYEGCILRKKKD
jgi:hypothetical protein